MRCLVFGLLILCGMASTANASVIPIIGYDINDAVVSGHGLWGHTYTGSIINQTNFANNGAGIRADYTGGGSGTLNDGVIGTTIATSQLFVGGQATGEYVNGVPTGGPVFDTTIFLSLPNAYTVDRIDLFGGDIPANAIPGFIEQVTVTLLKTDFTTVSETFSTTDFGINNSVGHPVNDRVDLTGSSLDGVEAYAVYLSGFIGPGDTIDDGIDNSFSTYGGWFSLTEIELMGELAPQNNNSVPEPASLATMAGSLILGGIGFYWRKKRAA